MFRLKASYELPSVINESSGIIQSGGCFFTMNDSGGDSVLYQLDNKFEITDKLFVPGIKNRDWEDLAFHNQTIYIGDFGNNANSRKKLRIVRYKAHQKTVEEIIFSYPDQAEYPPDRRADMNYDCEAMVWWNHSLLLFTKSKKSRNPTGVYRVPDTSGFHEAQKLGSIPVKGKVTSAFVNTSDSLLYVLTYGKILVYRINDISAGMDAHPVYCKKFLRARQSEAITLTDSNRIVITNEQQKVYVFERRSGN